MRKKGKKYNEKMRIKTELKIHVMYEGWKKDSSRHELVNKQYMSGIMEAKESLKLQKALNIEIWENKKVRFCSGRKSFSLHSANALAKVCVQAKEKAFKIADLEKVIPLDTSVTDWINEIENNIMKKV